MERGRGGIAVHSKGKIGQGGLNVQMNLHSRNCV